MTSHAEAGWGSVDGAGAAAGRDGRWQAWKPGGGIDVLELDRPRDLRGIANPGLTLPEAKQMLTRVQQAVVAVQARDHAALRPACLRCGARCQVKDGSRVRSRRGRDQLARALSLDP